MSADAAETGQLGRRLALAVLLGLVLGGLLLTFGVRFVRVEGRSMSPALRPGDVVVVSGLFAALDHIEPGDVVLARPGSLGSGPDHQVIKRVRRVLREGDATFYVLRGDRPDLSRDSRDFGPVPEGSLAGKAWLVLRDGVPWRAHRIPAHPSSRELEGSATGSGPSPAGR